MTKSNVNNKINEESEERQFTFEIVSKDFNIYSENLGSKY